MVDLIGDFTLPDDRHGLLGGETQIDLQGLMIRIACLVETFGFEISLTELAHHLGPILLELRIVADGRREFIKRCLRGLEQPLERFDLDALNTAEVSGDQFNQILSASSGQTESILRNSSRLGGLFLTLL